MIIETIVAFVIGALLVTFFVVSLRPSKKSISESDAVPAMRISIGKDVYRLKHVVEDNVVALPLEDFNLISIFINSLVEYKDISIQWSSSFMEKDYLYALPNKLSLFQNMANIAIQMRPFTKLEKDVRKYEKLFMSLYADEKYLGTITIVVWYYESDFLNLKSVA